MNDARTRQWLALTAALNRTMKEHAPGWTDHSEHDPGLTMLDLIAYVTEGLQRHSTVVEGSAA